MNAIYPFHRVNVLTGTKQAMMLEDARDTADLIKKAQRPLLVIGAMTASAMLGDKPLMEYAVDISKVLNIPICATAHTKKKLLELGVEPASSYDIIEIINHLKDPAWSGVKKEGNHDLVLFLGFRTDLAEQGLSTLKHFAPHLKTITLCKYYYPNADYSLPNFANDAQWREFLDSIIQQLKSTEV